MHVRRTQHNWTLYFLFALSLTLHLGAFICFNGFYKERTETRIEITIQDIVDPTKRVFPKPLNRTRLPAKTKDIEKLTLEPLSINQVDYSHLKKLETIEVPDFVKSSNPLNTWNPPISTESSDQLSSHEYLAMVRLRIERHKKYPDAARTRQLEGEVLIYFAITLDGNVEAAKVTRSSGHSILDNAALKAVRNAAPFQKPPAESFKGKIPIEVPIIFELL
jgi:protein TonB